MADNGEKTTQLLLDGLSRAVAEPRGLLLHNSKNAAGLFPSTAVGRSAAKLCKEENYLQAVRSQANGQKTSQVWTITEKGLAYLLHSLQMQVQNVLSAMPQLARLTSNPRRDEWQSAALAYLDEWSKSRPSDDCALPELYLYVRRSVPELTIGQFHDGLRRLHADQKLRLHPWTGPLSEIPEPACALLVGHAICYYASTKNGD